MVKKKNYYTVSSHLIKFIINPLLNSLHQAILSITFIKYS